MERPLYHLVKGGHHVITEVVETEFVIRPVGDIGIVGNLSLLEIQVMNDEAYREAQKFINLAHPFAVALGQVIVDRNDVDALSFQCIQVYRRRSNQGFTFAGAHLGDVAPMEDNAADELHIEVPHAQYTAGRFTDDRKSLGQEIVQCLPLGQTGFELIGLVGQGSITELLQSVFQRIDLLFYNLADLLDFLFVRPVEQSVKKLIKH